MRTRQWREAAEIAKIAESTWKEATKAAIKEGSTLPERPDAAKPGQEPFLPRLCVADGTVEQLAVILEKQARGTLAARDKLAGWLQGMTRYSVGGSDRPFWLEAYGGRAYTVERMGREPPSDKTDKTARTHLQTGCVGFVGNEITDGWESGRLLRSVKTQASFPNQAKARCKRDPFRAYS